MEAAMRIAQSVLLLFAASALNVALADPASSVFTHECRAINPKQTGFECSISPAGLMRIHWHEDLRKMSPERRQKAEYEADRLVMRYFDLGFGRFLVRNDVWGKDRMRTCARARRSGYHWNCAECDLKGENCREISH